MKTHKMTSNGDILCNYNPCLSNDEKKANSSVRWEKVDCWNCRRMKK